ncbi:hypothetical protein [Fulvivirga sedimenti]|uniref:DUF2306 domain-containing protein n=1 Tax=Fulvivirga sedimenti TaxID=2879465 RepID=A0A9X1HND5_9BACT|nr:hypothetical protein [Fulvivirga sedimenti]MCA6073782.1 hypothetical protein [Fulvivirga sedimenti]
MKKPTRGEPFFYYFSIVLLLTVVLAFGLNILLRNYHLDASMPVIVTHGISMLLWYSLFSWQTRLVRTGNIQVHMKLGLMSILLAIVLVISGILIAIGNFQGEGEALTLFGNFSGMFLFGLFYTLAIINRKKPDIHKRLMLVASVAMLSPALVRILRIFDINDFVTLPFWLIFILALPVYDFRKYGKVYKSTWMSIAFLLILMFGGSAYAFSESWQTLAASLFGR